MTKWTPSDTEISELKAAWEESADAVIAKLPALFEAWVKQEGVKVYGYIGTHASTWSTHPPGTFIQENLSHEAYLVLPREIEK